MGRLSRCFGFVVLSLALFVPSFAAQDTKAQDGKKVDGKEAKKDDQEPKKADNKKVDAKKTEEKKLVFSAKYLGKITELSEANFSDFTLQVTYKVAEPNQDAQNQLAEQQRRLVQLQTDLARAKTQQDAINRSREIQNHLNQMAQTQRNLVRYKDMTTDVKLRLAENIKVRTAYPPLDYDDKGNIKKYTAKELAALRGTSGLPGYQADKDLLRVGQMVEVYLSASKGAANPKGAGDTKVGKDQAKKKGSVEELVANANRPEVVLVVIQQEPTK